MVKLSNFETHNGKKKYFAANTRLFVTKKTPESLSKFESQPTFDSQKNFL